MLIVARAQGQQAVPSLVRWCPHDPSPKQQTFLELNCREALYGGAAGGGKSDALLMGALQYVDRPSYKAGLFRQTYTDLSLPGALMDRAHEWLDGTEAHWDGNAKTWRFPSGASLTFGYLDSDKDHLRYKSSEFHFLGFDELSEFREFQYRYMFSRARRGRGDTIPIRVRGGTNPGAKWVQERFGIPENIDFEHVYEHEGRAFVPSTLEDNPAIDQVEYEAALRELDTISYQQLRFGKWVYDLSGRVYYDIASKYLAPGSPLLAGGLPPIPRGTSWAHIFAADFGITDATAFGVLAFHRHSPVVYLVESDKWEGLSPSEAAEIALTWQERYRFEQWVGDISGLGKAFQSEWSKRFQLPLSPADKMGKLGFIKLLNGAAKNGDFRVLVGSNSKYLEEVQQLRWKDAMQTKEHPEDPNHLTDMALYGWRACRGWNWKTAPADKPQPGTPEYARDLQAKAKEEARRRAARLVRRNPRYQPGPLG